MFTNRMKPSSVAPWIAAACMVGAASASSGRAAGASADGVVVFGTSLSDAGNAFVFSGGTNGPPSYSVSPLLIPDRPYSMGGHHFSNGATWIEQFALGHGWGASVQPAFQSTSPQAANYAVGAARAREDGVQFNLSKQVNAFLEQSGGVAPAERLYVIEMGSNDVRDALQSPNPGGVLQAALNAMAANITLLHSKGATRFLVMNVPNISLTPAIAMVDTQIPGAKQGIDLLTMMFNAGLSGVLGSLSALPGIDIRTLNAYQLVTDMVGNPDAFGLTNVTTACITPNVTPFACEDPDQFLFWDGIHPTRAVHAVVAHRAGVLLAQ
jgi:phospholipase/lecithinase/hemolysin